MLMVPTLVPVPVVIVVEVAGVGDELAAPAGAAGLPVWAHAEIIETTAMARTDRKNLLVIGSLTLLGTLVPVNMVPGMNSDSPISGNAGPYSRGLRLGLAFPATAAVRQGALDCQRHTPGLRTCRPPLISFLQWRGSSQL